MNTETFKKVNAFFLQFNSFHYKKRETILFTKDVPPGVFYITKGYVRSYLLSKEGKELTVTLLKPFDVFPMHWVINNVLTSHYYEALVPVEVYRCPKKNFLFFLEQNHDVFFYIISLILLRLQNSSERIEAAVLGNASAKIAGMLEFLIEIAGTKSGSGVVIDLPITHKDIAAFIGLARETVSIEVERLRREGILEQKAHRFVIKDLKKLKEETNID